MKYEKKGIRHVKKSRTNWETNFGTRPIQDVISGK